ncbi:MULTISPECIES: hypothetical protein [Halorussus]|uniref:hypothetical protein n=1 Tax=Halorussus TaxID=1070314 RepID=UPI0013B36597|nr:MULTISPECIES: hypothetical protein [Halorussus]NHN60425.1 hypothetical protein [Halorussus sp. JP-T4]
MLATATFSLGGIGSVSADASAQSTEPLEIEDVSVSVGSVTNSIGLARFVYDDGTMGFGVQDWTMESDDRSLSVETAAVTATDVSEETYATLREGMVESFDGRTLTPLLVALQEADVNPESEVQMVLESVEQDGSLVADQVTANGVAGDIVADGTRSLLDGGPTLEELAALGPSEWDSLTIQRGDAELTANDVVMEVDGATVAISAPNGSADVSGRAFEFSEMTMNIMPPGTIPEEHIEFASRVRESGTEGDLSLSTIVSAAEDSGVTADNTAEAVRNAQFELSFAEVTEDGETVVSNFATSGTLAELLAALQQRT